MSSEDDERASSLQELQELLDIEKADAWFEYLEATRGKPRSSYEELEAWAWSRLRQRLRGIRKRRRRLRLQTA